jgi:PleD family two-component response regulator
MPYLHMVLLASRQSKKDIIAGLEPGADDYLTKLFHPEELRARLRTGGRILRQEDNLEQARPVATATGPIAVSTSLGAAGTGDWLDSNAKQLIKEADIALYRAKQWDRNRVVLAKRSGLTEIRAFRMTPDPVSAD